MFDQQLLRDIVFLDPELLTNRPYWAGHIPFAFWLVDVTRPNILVELGTETGVSYCAMCQAVKHIGLPTSCYAVDTWKGDEHTGAYDESVYNRLVEHHDPRYSSFSRLLRSRFEDAVQHFSEGSIDLLHIDGFHTYEAVRNDYETWRSKLSERAVILLHDTNVRERDYYVWRFWEEISREKPSFAFLHSNGLGIVAWGPEQSSEIRWLTELETANPQALPEVRRFFSLLGSRFEEYSLRIQFEQRLRETEQEFLRINEHARVKEAALEMQCAATARELEEVRTSISWRITAPLRSVAKIILRE